MLVYKCMLTSDKHFSCKFATMLLTTGLQQFFKAQFFKAQDDQILPFGSILIKVLETHTDHVCISINLFCYFFELP